MGKTFFYIILGVAAILAIVFAWIYLKPESKQQDNNSSSGGGSGSGGGTGVSPGTGNTTNTGSSTTSPSIKTLNNFVGSNIVAKYNNTKLYDNDLKVVRTFSAGERIGWLGEEAVGYKCCTNRSSYYKIHGTTVGNSGFCGCEPVMANYTLKQIFNLV